MTEQPKNVSVGEIRLGSDTRENLSALVKDLERGGWKPCGEVKERQEGNMKFFQCLRKEKK